MKANETSRGSGRGAGGGGWGRRTSLGSGRGSPSSPKAQPAASPAASPSTSPRTSPGPSLPSRSSPRCPWRSPHDSIARDAVGRDVNSAEPEAQSRALRRSRALGGSSQLPRGAPGTPGSPQVPRRPGSPSPRSSTEKAKRPRARPKASATSSAGGPGLAGTPVTTPGTPVTSPPPPTTPGTPNCRWTPPPSAGDYVAERTSPRRTPLAASGGKQRPTPNTPASASSATGSAAATDSGPSPDAENMSHELICDTDLHVQRYMWPRSEGPLVALCEEEVASQRGSCKTECRPQASASREDAALPTAQSSSNESRREAVLPKEQSPPVVPRRPIVDKAVGATDGAEASRGRTRSYTWQPGGVSSTMSTVHDRDSQEREQGYNFKDKDSAMTSAIADNALEKSQQLIKELMSQGLWEDDDEPAFSVCGSDAGTGAAPLRLPLGEGSREKIEASGRSAGCNVDQIPASHKASTNTLHMDNEMCPNHWGLSMDVTVDPEIVSSLLAPSRSPSRMSTAPTTVTTADLLDVPRGVLEEVARLRQRISELEEHIRRSDVASLRASLQASPLASPFGRGGKGSGLSQERVDSLLSTQEVWSPSRWSDRTRVTLSSSMSSCDGGLSPKKAFYVHPPSAAPALGSSSSSGRVGGAPHAVPYRDSSPPPVVRDCQSSPQTARVSFRFQPSPMQSPRNLVGAVGQQPKVALAAEAMAAPVVARPSWASPALAQTTQLPVAKPVPVPCRDMASASPALPITTAAATLSRGSAVAAEQTALAAPARCAGFAISPQQVHRPVVISPNYGKLA